MLSALKMEKGAMGWIDSKKLAKGKETDSPLEPPEGTQPCHRLGFRPAEVSDHQDCNKINLCCVKTLDGW